MSKRKKIICVVCKQPITDRAFKAAYSQIKYCKYCSIQKRKEYLRSYRKEYSLFQKGISIGMLFGNTDLKIIGGDINEYESKN